MPKSDQNTLHNSHQLPRLLDIIERFWDPKIGCPRDQKQSFESIVVHTSKETYEVADGIYNDVCEGIDEKTHKTDDELRNQWALIKFQERASKNKELDTSILANIPKGMTPLLRAQKIQKTCSKVGFDWTELLPVVDKIHEEINEVLAEVNVSEPDQQAVE